MKYEPFGWHHWQEHFFLSYQFRRGLGETQEGGGAISEIFQAASRMVPGDKESWHREWLRMSVSLPKVPELLRQVRKLEERVKELEEIARRK